MFCFDLLDFVFIAAVTVNEQIFPCGPILFFGPNYIVTIYGDTMVLPFREKKEKNSLTIEILR